MSDPFGATYWEDRYRHQAASAHGPSAHLVDGLRDLAPGTSLEAGCGEGANATWLARSGWRVTAVDVSATALTRARDLAATMPPEVAARITWVEADLETWLPGPGPFDLVSSHYVHPAGGWHDLVARLAGAVAPGGTLLVVDHDHADAHAHVRVAPDELAAALPADEWKVEVAEVRSRGAGHRAAERTLHDAVLVARRRR